MYFKGTWLGLMAIFFYRKINSVILLALIHCLTQHYTEIQINNKQYFVFIVLPGVVEFIPEEIELWAKKLTKQEYAPESHIS